MNGSTGAGIAAPVKPLGDTEYRAGTPRQVRPDNPLASLMPRLGGKETSRKVVSFTALILVGTLLAFGRLPAAARGTLWAEDGGFFIKDALSRNGVLGVFAPYEGYLHVVPRTAAKIVVRIFAVDDYAVAMSFLSCLTVAIIAAVVFHCSKAVSTHLYVRLAWASITILVAPGPVETLGNFANVHWYFLWLVPWLLFKPTKSRGEATLLFVVAGVASLTEILTLMFVPLFFYRWKERAYWPARAGLLIGLGCQILTTLFHPRSPSSGYPVNLISVAEGWFLNSSSAVVYGSSTQISQNILNFGALPIALAAVPFFLVFVYLLVRGNPQQRLVSLVFVVGSVGAWAAALVLNFQNFFDYAAFDASAWHGFSLSRYSTVPSMFLIALLPLLASTLQQKFRTAVASIIAAFVLLQCIYFFPWVSSRMDGPDWAAGTRSAREACLADPALQVRTVAVAPRGWPAGNVPIPCAKLRN